ncbi:MAG: rod-binding protein [Candidatus Coatesbacteria bacterium]|nr:rod-binding protein [Candidatus Coatesbacteria bacterium]
MEGNSLIGGAMDLNRFASEAGWQRLLRQAETAKSKVECSGGRIMEMDEAEREDLRGACQQFESLFLGYLMKQMRKTVQRSSFLPETPAEKIYMSMFDDEVAKAACKGGGIGLGDMIFESLTNSMEVQSDKGEEESAKELTKESAKVPDLTYR